MSLRFLMGKILRAGPKYLFSVIIALAKVYVVLGREDPPATKTKKYEFVFCSCLVKGNITEVKTDAIG